jgi:hypothetical protein
MGFEFCSSLTNTIITMYSLFACLVKVGMQIHGLVFLMNLLI